MNKMRWLLPTFALLLISGGWFAAAETEQERKADYIFMEASRHNAMGNDDAYFELLNGAYGLDTTESGVGQTLGYYMMYLGQEDSAMTVDGYRMMKRHFDLHPEDYYGGIFYGMISNQLGDVDESIRVWSVLDSLNPSKPDVAMNLVEALQNRRDSLSLRRSLEVLQRIERSEGKDLGLTSHKLRAQLALRDTADALVEINSLLASSPRNAQYKLYAGDIYMAIGQRDTALGFYQDACRIDSTNGYAYYKLAQFYLADGDSIGYQRELEHAILQESLDVEAKTDLLRDYVGKLYGDSLRRPQIKNLFETLLVQHPHEADIRDLYSSYLIVTDDMRSAIEQQEYAVDADVANPMRWRSIISMYAQLDDPQGAIAAGKRALEFLPDDNMINLLTGANFQQLKEYATARLYYERAIECTPEEDKATRSQLEASIGDVFYAMEQQDSAFTYYRKAIDLDPNNLLALNNFAYYLAENNRDLDQAERYASICVRANPDNYTAVDTYAWIFFKKKDYVKAKEWIDQALKSDDESEQVEILDHAGDIYYMNQLPEEAMDFWQRALKLDPDNAKIKAKIKHRSPF